MCNKTQSLHGRHCKDEVNGPEQRKEPGRLVHWWFGGQAGLCSSHSLISATPNRGKRDSDRWRASQHHYCLFFSSPWHVGGAELHRRLLRSQVRDEDPCSWKPEGHWYSSWESQSSQWPGWILGIGPHTGSEQEVGKSRQTGQQAGRQAWPRTPECGPGPQSPRWRPTNFNEAVC